MKRAIIYWWFNGNLGDDLIVTNFINETNFDEYVLLKNIWAKNHGRKISRQSILTLSTKKNIVFSSETLQKTLRRGTYKNDNYFLLGGSIWKEAGLGLKDDFIQRAQKKGVKINAIGNNFSEYKRGDSKKRLVNISKNLNYLTLRDSFSAKMIGWTYHFDPVYSMNFDFLETGREKNKDDIIISVSATYSDKSFNNGNQKEFIQKISNEIVEQIYLLMEKEKVSKINLISFDDKKDVYVLKKILKIFKKRTDFRNIEIIKYNNIIKVLKEIKLSNYFFATRFHSIVLANMFSENIYAFSYDNKNINHLKDIEKAPNNWYSLSEVQLKKIIDDSKEHLEPFKNNNML